MSSADPILYLSGPSGSGKSSLIEASLIPKLKRQRFTVVEARVLGDPIGQIRDSLQQSFPDQAVTNDLYTSLKNVSNSILLSGNKRLLLILDQFEEFMIFGSLNDQEPFRRLLHHLSVSQISGLQVMLSLRSDYQSLIFRDELPDAIPKRNWFQLSPYLRADAQKFLEGSGQELTSESLDDIFGGLDKIEQVPGLYRPITLNVIGLVFSRVTPGTHMHPQKLIQSYLRDSVNSGDTKEYSIPVLASMISDSGTRGVKNPEEIHRETDLELWKIKATLAHLQGCGLVRRIKGNMWEVSHDFLARLLVPIVNGKRINISKKIITNTLIALSGWLLLVAVSIPLAVTRYKDHARDVLEREYHVRFSAGAVSQYPRLEFKPPLDQNEFAAAMAEIDKLDSPVEVDLSEAPQSNLDSLKKAPQIIALDISNSSSVDFNQILQLKNLIYLNASNITKTLDIIPLTKLKNLKRLLLNYDEISTISALSKLPHLTKLDLYVSNLKEITPILELTELKALNISHNPVRNLRGIESLSKLEVLKASKTDIDNLNALGRELINRVEVSRLV
jgi:NACHT domain